MSTSPSLEEVGGREAGATWYEPDPCHSEEVDTHKGGGAGGSCGHGEIGGGRGGGSISNSTQRSAEGWGASEGEGRKNVSLI